MTSQPLRSSILTRVVTFVLLVGGVWAQSFVNWENPHVHPLELTPDGSRLLAVNTPDGRLEVFDTTGSSLVPLASIPVGIDPVSVRARTDDEVWVVNRISDSVSVVRLSSANTVATLSTADEPADVVFAGVPQRAFVSCGRASLVQVYDPGNLSAAPGSIPILGVNPRALAVSPGGSKVYVAVFESGNSSTILGSGSTQSGSYPHNAVSDPSGPYGGQNPPPNSGIHFNPSISGGLPPPPPVGLIVKKDSAGLWKDDNDHDWTNMVSGAGAAKSSREVGWDLYDNDLAIVDVATSGVTYAKHLMNICLALAVNPSTGDVMMVGTDATNEIRFEPILKGKFLRVKAARVAASGAASVGIVDLNPHLTYQLPTVPQVERDRSIGDPRGIAWNAAGTKAYVTGMGSNNVVVLDAAGARSGMADSIPVGKGPTGIVVDDARGLVYVLEKFAARVTTISSATETVVGSTAFYDPTPSVIRAGREHLYDTHATSGLGHMACASCHVDGRADGLAWDLGNPSGVMGTLNGRNLGAGITGFTTGFEEHHPMKGPMVTQTLQDIVGKEPFHWRGDRSGLEEFNPAFVDLQGDDAERTPAQMQEFESFLATITFPPNPNRAFDNALPTNLPLPGQFTTDQFGQAGLPLPNGNAQNALLAFRSPGLSSPSVVRCATCHTLPSGAGTDTVAVGASFVAIAPGPNGEHHLALMSQDGMSNRSMKVPQLRNLYEKVGFDTTQLGNTRGFGFAHDGSIDTLPRFLSEPNFTFSNNQQVADMVAFLLSFSGSDLPAGENAVSSLLPPGPPSRDTHAAVGRQLTLSAPPTPNQAGLLSAMTTLAAANKVGLLMKGVRGGLARGAVFGGGILWSSDRQAESWTTAQLTSSAAVGSEITITVVPKGSEQRLGIDRDQDGWDARDELDLGSDPANPASHPGAPGTAFCFGDGSGTNCPCGNVSSAGSQAGCLNSTGSAGRLVAAGFASLSNDSLVLSGSGMPNGGTLYFQGTGSVAGGAGMVLGDGLLCVTGTLVRLGVQINSGGASQFPAPGSPSLSVAGGVVSPGLRGYQAWYRDAVPYCSPATYDLTNGWWTVWAP